MFIGNDCKYKFFQVNLVEQQREKLKSLLQPSSFFTVVGIHGSSESSLHAEVQRRKVIVLTAQLLENALNSIPLDRFSLLVFDECHLCQVRSQNEYDTLPVVNLSHLSESESQVM